mgnify:CR=1 FL=1
MGLFQNNRELQFGTCNLWQTTGKSRVPFFYKREGEFGEAVINKRVHWRRLGVKVWRLPIGWAATVSDWQGYGPGRG